MNIMKLSRNLKTVAVAAAALLIGILLVLMAGCAGPPTAREARFFDITTNVEPMVIVRTNYVPIHYTNYQVIQVPSTNPLAPPVTITNEYRLTVFETNRVTTTNLVESYEFKPGAGAREITEIGGAVGNIFGVGGLVSTALAGLFGIWAQVRSSRRYRTAGSLAQTIETLRAFIKALPDGARYDNELVNWMQTNQANAGVLQSVIGLLEREVSSSDAKEAARQIAAIIESLRTITPSTTVTKTS